MVCDSPLQRAVSLQNIEKMDGKTENAEAGIQNSESLLSAFQLF
jgi:hypothetical protein